MNRANRPRQPRIPGSSYASRALSRAGDGSTLSLDFTTGVLDSRLTFSRAGGGTYVGPDGYIYGIDSATSSSLAIGTGSKSVTLTATAGVNRRFEVGQTVYFSNGANNMSGLVTAYSPSTQVITINATSSSGSGSFTSWFVGNASARFDYDPTTLTPRGLLIEQAATNYLPGSLTLSGTGWNTGGSVTRTINYATGPDNVSNSASRLQMSYSGGNGRIYYDASAGYSTLPFTTSVWMKSNTGSNQTLNLWNTNGVGVTCTVTPQWQRFQSVSTAGTSLPGYFYLENPSAVTGVDILAWGAQLEAGSGASSYIPTGASTGSRAVDTAIIAAGTAFSGWYTGGLNGTFYADWYGGVAGASGTQRTVLATDDVTTKHLHLYQTATTNTMTLANYNGTSTLATSNAISPAGSRSKAAFSYATSAMNVCLNGGTVASGTVTGFTVAPTWLSIGAPSTNGTSITGTTVVLNNSIRSIKYWPTVLPNTTLQSLTA